MNKAKVLVAQMGARQHYQVPLMCQASGSLAQFITDFWVDFPMGISTYLRNLDIAELHRLLGRRVPGIPSQKVHSFPIMALWWWWRLKRVKGRDSLYKLYESIGKDFSIRVAGKLNDADYTTFFGFSGASLEALERSRRTGHLTILDEIAPTHLEEEILAVERLRFPELEPGGVPIPTSFLLRLEQEWDTAHRILVNSDWTKKALIARGVSSTKIFVVPIAYSTGSDIGPRREHKRSPLRVLWLGSLCLRKGLPYALEAARKMKRSPVKFTFAGPSDIDLRKIDWPDNTCYLGQVPRSTTEQIWACHDIFIFPTLSDGFGITQIEAMAHGLPVIATDCCGDVVEDRLSGLVIKPGSADAIVEAITRFMDGDIDISFASGHAQARARLFSPAEVWKQLEPVLVP